MAPTTLTITYCRRDVQSGPSIWNEHKTFVDIFQEFRYERYLKDHFNYALRNAFDISSMAVNVEPKKA